MTSLISTFLYVFTSTITVINPIGGGIFFLTLTHQAGSAERNALALRIGAYCFIMAVVCFFGGSFILSFFGISIDVLRVAGGIVLFSAGWLALNAKDKDKNSAEPVRPLNKDDYLRMAFYPLTLPLMMGPGTIAVTTAIGSSMHITPGNIIAALAGLLACSLCVYVCCRFSDKLTQMLGQAASDAVMRIFSFILVCLGVQIFWTGFSALWLELSAKAAGL